SATDEDWASADVAAIGAFSGQEQRRRVAATQLQRAGVCEQAVRPRPALENASTARSHADCQHMAPAVFGKPLTLGHARAYSLGMAPTVGRGDTRCGSTAFDYKSSIRSNSTPAALSASDAAARWSAGIRTAEPQSLLKCRGVGIKRAARPACLSTRS